MTAGPAPRTRILIARSADRAAGLAGRLRRAGIDTVTAPVIERAPVEDPEQLEALAAARSALSRGEYAWVAVTSVNAVDVLLPSRPASFPAHVRWACVGPATRRALEHHGITVSLVPDDSMTATGLVAAFPRAAGAEDDPGATPGTGAAPRRTNRVLLPLGDLAATTLPDGLRRKGWEPEVVIAYRTVSRELPRDVVDRAKGAGYDAVVVASGSAAREIAAQLGPQRVVAIGEPSATAARHAGHAVVAVAGQPTDAALAAAVVHAGRA